MLAVTINRAPRKLTIEEQAEADALANVPTTLSSIDFFSRFEKEELAIEEAAATDAKIRVFLRWATGADIIELNSNKVADGLEYLVRKGLLTPDRKAEILST